MEMKDLGYFIARLRKKKNLTQKALSEIVDVSSTTISRIENGNYSGLAIDKICFIFEKLGYDPSGLHVFQIGFKEQENINKREKIRELIGDKKYTEAAAAIKKLEKDIDFMQNDFNRQHLLLSQAKLMDYLDAGEVPSPIIYELLIKAIKITSPMFEEYRIKHFLFSIEEIRIIDDIAMYHYQNKEIDLSIRILKDLKASLDNNYIDDYFISTFYPNIFNCMAEIIMEKGEYANAITLCNEGIKICKKFKDFYTLPNLLFIKARCLANEKDESCKEVLKEAYYMAKGFGKVTFVEWLKSYAQDRLGITLE